MNLRSREAHTINERIAALRAEPTGVRIDINQVTIESRMVGWTAPTLAIANIIILDLMMNFLVFPRKMILRAVEMVELRGKRPIPADGRLLPAEFCHLLSCRERAASSYDE